MDPISAPLARVGDINRVGERLTVWNAALGDTDRTIIPCRLIKKHAMVVEGAGAVKVVGRMNYEGVVCADRNRRGTRNLIKNGEKAERKEKTDGQVPLTPIARLGMPKPSGLMS